jgi:hypothetical protein
MIIISKEQVKTLIRNSNSKYYSYVLIRNDGEPYYVGVGKGTRVFNHTRRCELEGGSNRLKNNVTLKELKNFGSINYAILGVNGSRKYCLDLEVKFILKYGLKVDGSGTLTNLTKGGEGCRGYIQSEKTKSLKSKLGLLRADEFRSYANKQWQSYDEEQYKIRRAHFMSVRLNEVARSKIAIKSKEMWSDPEYKKRLSEKQRVSQLLIRDEKVLMMKEKWSDPEFREMMLLARKIAREKKLANLNANTTAQ